MKWPDLWLYRVRASVDRLGTIGGIGLALLFGCAVFYLAAIQPAEEELNTLQEQRAADERARRDGRVALDTPAQLSQFKAFFPSIGSTSRWLALIYSAAQAEGLKLAQGTYKLRPDHIIDLTAYEVTLPVRGSYPQIRRFVGRVLNDVPAAALENITFQRERPAEGEVNARVVIVLHMHDADATPGGHEAPARQEAQGNDGVLARAEVAR